MTMVETRATGGEEARLREESKYLTFALANEECGQEILKVYKIAKIANERYRG